MVVARDQGPLAALVDENAEFPEYSDADTCHEQKKEILRAQYNLDPADRLHPDIQ